MVYLRQSSCFRENYTVLRGVSAAVVLEVDQRLDGDESSGS